MQKLTDQGWHALLYAITNRKDEISFRIRWTQTFWKRIWSVSHSIAPSTLTAKRLTTGTESLRNKNTLSCKCYQFYVATFSLPVSLAATRVVPIPFPRALTRSADLDDACYIIHTLLPACLLVTSWYLVSSRSKCVIDFVCSDSAVRTGRAHQYFSMAAGCLIMPVKDLVLASRLHVFSNVMSLQTPLNWASVWRTAICPYWMPSIWSDLV